MNGQGRVALTVCVGIVAIGLCAPGAGAQGGGQGRGTGQGRQTGQGKPAEQTTVSASVRVEIGARDREVITNYYTTRAAGLPPGLAKRGGDLPPGLEKQLQKNGQLPPGLDKKLEPMPDGLVRRLAKLPDGYSWFSLGAHVVVVNKQANIVGDFVLNVVR